MSNQGGNSGTVFKVNLDGTAATTMHIFTWFITHRVADGAYPISGPTIVGSELFGVTQDGGGITTDGCLFKMNTDGSGFSVLVAFDGNNGQVPYASLAASASTLFGSTQFGGNNGAGTLFKVNTDGSAFDSLHTFTKTDGQWPVAAMTLSNSTLFGTTRFGGALGGGTVFKINSDGTGFTVLHNFEGADGADRESPLTLVGETLYGMTSQGGSGNSGTVFKINTNGSDFGVLHSFSSDHSEGFMVGNNGLAAVGTTLYGATSFGGSGSKGVLFSISTDGSAFSILHNFGAFETDGQNPDSQLVLLDSQLFGSTVNGGYNGVGTIFTYAVPEPSSMILLVISVGLVAITMK